MQFTLTEYGWRKDLDDLHYLYAGTGEDGYGIVEDDKPFTIYLMHTELGCLGAWKPEHN